MMWWVILVYKAEMLRIALTGAPSFVQRYSNAEI